MQCEILQQCFLGALPLDEQPPPDGGHGGNGGSGDGGHGGNNNGGNGDFGPNGNGHHLDFFGFGQPGNGPW